MSRRTIAGVAALALLAGGASAGGDGKKPAPGAKGDPPKKRSLSLGEAASFGTATGSTLRVNLVGKDWALVLEFDIKDFPYHDGDLPLKASLKPRKATYYTGPDVGSYVKPPAGVPQMPIPTDGKYAAVAVKNLTVDLVAKERLREPDAHVFVKLSEFTVGDEQFAGLAEFRLFLRGPYP
jgi:hypothetical protein